MAGRQVKISVFSNRLYLEKKTMHIAFQRYPRKDLVRGVTPRRIAAAKRALQRERDKLPLFAELIAEEQPTPEARVQAYRKRTLDILADTRKRIAQDWLEIRNVLREMPDRDELLKHWNNSHVPKYPWYMFGLIHKWKNGWRPIAITEEEVERWRAGSKAKNMALYEKIKARQLAKENS